MSSIRHMVSLYKRNYSRFLPDNKQARVLDIGCGMGQFLAFMGQEGYENILGVDISLEAINFCLEKGINKVEFIDNLEEFLNKSPMYDLIVLNDVIEHIPKEQIIAILEKIYEKLNFCGRIIVKTGNMSSIIGSNMRYIDFSHEIGFTEYSLLQVLKVCDFKGTVIYPFVFPKNSPIRVFRWAVQKLIHLKWKLIYFFEFTNPPKIVDEIIFAVGEK